MHKANTKPGFSLRLIYFPTFGFGGVVHPAS